MTGFYENFEVGNIKVGTIAGGSVTQRIYDNSSNVATTAYVTTQTRQSMGTVILSNIAVGTYSFNSLGSEAEIDFTAIDGKITSINSISVLGNNYQIGDLVIVDSGNYDAFLRIAGESAGEITSIEILNNGTGYSSGNFALFKAVASSQFTYWLVGELVNDATILMTRGSYLTQSNQWIIINNTTGAHTVTVKISSDNNTPMGTGVVIPQGTNNSTSMFIQTDGISDVWVCGVSTFDNRNGAVILTSSDVTTALSYTPYNATNPDGYLTSINSSNITTALGYNPLDSASFTSANVIVQLGYTPYDANVNANTFITSATANVVSFNGNTGVVILSSADVTDALGYTPYDEINPAGYITGSGTSANVITNANLTGDVTSIGNETTLTTVNSNTGQFGNSTNIPQFTVNAKGLVTSASNIAINLPAAGNLTGPITSLALATAIAQQTGTGNVFVMNASPTINSPTLTSPSLGIPVSGDFSSGSFTWPTFNQNTTGDANNTSYLGGVSAAGYELTLGYTPYNATNPEGYISGIDAGNVLVALGYTPYDANVNANGYITSSDSIAGSANNSAYLGGIPADNYVVTTDTIAEANNSAYLGGIPATGYQAAGTYVTPTTLDNATLAANVTSLYSTGNITADSNHFFIGNGSLLTGIVSGDSGTVTSVSVVSDNGFAGTVSTDTTTPAITISTTVTGILVGNGIAVNAATSEDFPTLNQDTTGSANNASYLGGIPSADYLTSGGSLGTPSSGDATNLTGTAAGITSGNVTSIGNLTGDVTSVNRATTLATVNSNTGQFGDASHVSQFTVNNKGLVIQAANVLIPNTVQLSGDVTSTGGTTSANAIVTLNTVNSDTGTFGNATYIPQITVNNKGLISGVVAVAASGAPSPGVVPVGGIIMWSGTIATIPATWSLCDGTANSPGPDLRDKFVVGATSDSGGAAKTNLTGSLTQSGAAAVSAHTLSTNVAVSAHTLSTNVALSAHSLTTNVAIADHTLTTSAGRTSSASTRAFVTTTSLTHSITQPVVGAHTITQPVVSAHSVTQPVVADHTSNWPTYFALAYIQRMS